MPAEPHPYRSICVIGAQGMLGHELMALAGQRTARTGTALLGLDRAEVNITDPASIESALAPLRPDLILNAAAYTDVDGAETHEADAFAVNAAGPGHLARFAARHGARLIHVSTDFVFDGTARSPYPPEAAMNPLGAYGRSKAAGERQVLDALPEAVIVRTSWLFGEQGKNFVKTMLRLAAERPELTVVRDQEGCPTYSRDLAEAMFALADLGPAARGVYHFCNAGVTSWHGFAVEIVRGAGLTTPVRAITTAEFPRPARRAAYSALDTARFTAATGLAPRPWTAALTDCLSRLPL